MYAVTAILAALRHRDRTGQGQAIDMALLDTQVAMLANLGAGYLASGVAPGRAGNAHQSIVPYQVFKVADGHLILAVGNDAQFARFCAVAGCAELAADERFARNAGRVRHREVLVPLLAARLVQRGRAAWLAELEAANVPCGPINDLAEVFADPQVRERAMTVEMAHPLAGTVRLVASPMKLAATPVRYRLAPPLLGNDTTPCWPNSASTPPRSQPCEAAARSRPRSGHGFGRRAAHPAKARRAPARRRGICEQFVTSVDFVGQSGQPAPRRVAASRTAIDTPRSARSARRGAVRRGRRTGNAPRPR
jgi:hypothetical protein